MKIKALALVGSIAMIGAASATVTLQFNAPGFLGEGGEVSGIVWGVVVDVDGDGLEQGSYLPGFSLTSGQIITGSGDDLLWLGFAPSQTLNAAGGGFITNAAGVPDAEGNEWGIIWFNSSLGVGDTTVGGETYGFLAEGEVMPAPGYNGAATITDRTAKDQGATLVPEPSAAALGLLGVLGLLRRRR